MKLTLVPYLLICWLLITGTVYAWPRLRERLAAATRPALSLVAAVVMAIFVFFVISTVNIALVRADIIYKQGQQFDNQGNWVSDATASSEMAIAIAASDKSNWSSRKFRAS